VEVIGAGFCQHSLANFYVLVLSLSKTFFQNALFLCLEKLDHVTNFAKGLFFIHAVVFIHLLEPVLKYNRAYFRTKTMNNCRHDTIPLLNDGVNLREHFVLT